MLNTLRFQCRVGRRLMPNYGRLQKVNKSMKRLSTVWNERAYLKLLNKELEQQKKFDEKLSKAIEYRRIKRFQLREDIKNKFNQLINKYESKKIIDDTENNENNNTNDNTSMLYNLF